MGVKEEIEKEIQSIYKETQDLEKRISINHATIKRLGEIINKLPDNNKFKVFTPRVKRNYTLQGVIARILTSRCNEILTVEEIYKEAKIDFPDIKKQSISGSLTALCGKEIAVRFAPGQYRYGFPKEKDIREDDAFAIHGD